MSSLKPIFLLALLLPLACCAHFPVQTNEPIDYFVSSSLGNDANSCTSQQNQCKTIQGALNKIPKRLRHVVTVTVASGYYDGFVVEGFEVHPSWGPGGAGLIIQGTTEPASPDA